jgi:hypothetical protein
MEGSEPAVRLRPARVAAEVLRIYAARWQLLIGVGLIIFVPIGLVEVLDDLAQEPLADEEGVSGVRLALLLVAGSAHAVTSLLGEVLYSGVVAAIVLAYRGGKRSAFAEVARSLPYARLIGADLLFVLIVALGTIALIVPGLIALTWFALIGPVIKMEGSGAVACFRRSRELVRGNGWRVFGVIFPIMIAQGLIAEAVHAAVSGALGEAFGGALAASVAANLLASPFYALVVVVIYFELAAPATRASRPSPGTPPRSSRPAPSAGPP